MQNKWDINWGGMLMPDRTFSPSTFAGFNGKRMDNEISGQANAYDFGARLYDPRKGRWNAIDRQADKYTSYSPYHFGYNNPIAVKDDDGEENIVVVGNQGSDPNSDKTGWKSGWGVWGEAYRYKQDTRHFLSAALTQAAILKKNHTENNEETTMLVYTGDYTEDELYVYETAAKKLNINFKKVSKSSEIKDYINKSGGYSHNKPSPKGRGDDLITDFTYIGHGLYNAFLVGHGSDNGDDAIFGSDLSPNAFYKSCNARFYGCGNGLEMADYFKNNLVGGNIFGFKTTAIWGANGLGSVAPHTQEYTLPGILRRNNPARKDLPEQDRYRNDKGKAGKEGKVNGSKVKKHYNVRTL